MPIKPLTADEHYSTWTTEKLEIALLDLKDSLMEFPELSINNKVDINAIEIILKKRKLVNKVNDF